jgi:hypothetical protein
MVMMHQEVVGHRARVLTPKCSGLPPRPRATEPLEGTIVRVADYGGGDIDFWMRLDGSDREFVFSARDVELRPPSG